MEDLNEIKSEDNNPISYSSILNHPLASIQTLPNSVQNSVHGVRGISPPHSEEILSNVSNYLEILSEFNDFRRITSWRLIDKISFKENPRSNGKTGQCDHPIPEQCDQ